MPTYKAPAPPSRSGNDSEDIAKLYSWANETHSQLTHVLSCLDEENISETLLNNTEE